MCSLALRPIRFWLLTILLLVTPGTAAAQPIGDGTILCPRVADWTPGSEGCPCEQGWRPTAVGRDIILRNHRKWRSLPASARSSVPGRAILCGADLNDANLSGADLSEADLSGAELQRANLSGIVLWRASLSGANLRRANLGGTVLGHANLSGADLSFADLSGAELNSVNLSDANLFGANLSDTDLSHTNLSGADLAYADLNLSELFSTRLDRADFTGVDLTGSIYEPASAPDSGTLTGITGLTQVRFERGYESGIVLLRARLEEAGLRQLEREATFSIERTRTHYMITEPDGSGEPVGGWLRRIFFEWTTGYGLYPDRALLVLLALWATLALFAYAPAISAPFGTDRTKTTDSPEYVASGIYRVWPAERMISEGDTIREAGHVRIEQVAMIGNPVLPHAFHFSLLSAFHIGWRDLNVGSWITRIQRREYTLRARGWVRVVSGMQSLASVYLLAIWVLTYFGRPFQ